jgi:BlaI family penicillinase repressor
MSRDLVPPDLHSRVHPGSLTVADHHPHAELSRRERQIMDVIYRRGSCSVADVREGISDPPSYSAVRALLRILVEKGHLVHEQDGPRYQYRPVVPRSEAQGGAIQHVVRTFFAGSASAAVTALLESDDLTAEDLDRLSEVIAEARSGKAG